MILLVLPALFLLSCEKEETKSLNELAYDYIWGAEALTGWGDIIAAAYTTSPDYAEYVRIYQFDEDKPNNLIHLSDVFSGVETLYSTVADIYVDSQHIVLAQNSTQAAGGMISIFKILPSGVFNLDGFFSIPYNVRKACIFNDVLLVSSAIETNFYSIEGGDTALLNSFPRTEKEGVSLTYPNGFITFHANGYSIFDCTDPQAISKTDFIDQYLKDCRNGIRYGNYLYLGGPSRLSGHTKIIRARLAGDDGIEILKMNEDIPGEYKNFTYDGELSYYAFTEDRVFQYIEEGDDFKLKSFDYMGFDHYYKNFFFSRNSRIYAIESGVRMYMFE